MPAPMRSIPLALPFLLAALACGREAPGRLAAADSAAPPPEAAAEPWTIRLDGVGPVRFGMALADARAALRDSLVVAPPDGQCGFTVPRDAPAGVRFMVKQGKLVRVDLDSSGVRTTAGAEVGMSEAEVRGRYPVGLPFGAATHLRNRWAARRAVPGGHHPCGRVRGGMRLIDRRE